MKNIKLIRLEIRNFKCFNHLKIDFNGENISIYGDNGTGKTTVYDSLMWLLFSKDSRGNGSQSFEVKPLGEGGKVKDHDAITEVEAVLLVDGVEMIFKRTYSEVWSTKRGYSIPVYDGNQSDYYVDGVPCKKMMFDEKVRELVEEETFRLLTNVSYFSNGISWQERRAVLFSIANVRDDDTIMAENERFSSLLAGKGRLSLDDYKKKLLADKRGFVGAKNDIPARISECERTILDVSRLDFAQAKSNVESLKVQKEQLEAKLLALEYDGAAEGKRLEIRAAGMDLEALEGENRAFRAEQTKGSIDVSGMRKQLDRLLFQKQDREGKLRAARASQETLTKEISEARARWIATNAESCFTASVCPTCGQALPSTQQVAASDRFEMEKRRRLLEIEQTANAKKESKAQIESRIADLISEIEDRDREILTIQNQIQEAEFAKIDPVDMAGYQARKEMIEQRIAVLSSELSDMMTNTSEVRYSLRKELSELDTAIKAEMEICSKETLLDYTRDRIEELKADAQNASACLDAIEQMLFLIDEYARYKTKFVEDSVNGLFRITRFRLFREQANGGVEDRCDATYNDIPYINVNNAAKINLGIDIINTLSRAYGVRVPLFVDNAESVTKLEQFDGQIIRLIVSENDKELRVEYEN